MKRTVFYGNEQKRSYVRTIQFLMQVTINGRKFVPNEIVNPRHYQLHINLIEHLENEGMIKVNRYNKTIKLFVE